MSSLVESLSRWVERVEILARGVENERRAAEAALRRDRPLEAREGARAILLRVPESIVGLALWADSAEQAWLDDEALSALERLSEALPWRVDVWLRLGAVRERLGLSARAREAYERAAGSTAGDEESRAARRAALHRLCDLDLADADPARAARWLSRATPALGAEADHAHELRRAECAFALGDHRLAEQLALAVPDPTGEAPLPSNDPTKERGRWVLLHARLGLERARGSADPRDRAQATALAIRAFLLDAPGADRLLATLIATTDDAAVLGVLRDVARGEGRADEARFEAAFALAEGRRADARAALVRAFDGGDAQAADDLLTLAVESRDTLALAAVVERAPARVPSGLGRVLEARRALDAGHVDESLDLLEEVGPPAEAWAASLRNEALRAWVRPGRVAWGRIHALLHAEARRLGLLELAVRCEGLALELERPLLLAVVGEFNAGKSTFINALLGGDVAPTGVLPTTATLHRVAWAPDAFARILVQGGVDRVVPHAELKSTLSELGDRGSHVDRVLIYAPFERLRKVEILDTPGFNAPDPRHIESARGAFDEAHAVVWLLDATAALKQSEARILSEVAERGLPIVVLLNKLDRLKPDEVAVALEHAAEGLSQIGVPVHAGPLAFSARRALAGLLGDAEALEASRWREVEALLAEAVVDRSEALRDRSLLRKSAELSALVLEAARREHELLAEQRLAEQLRVESLQRAWGELTQREAQITSELCARLAGLQETLEADFRPVRALAEQVRIDEELRAYAVSRLVSRLAPALVDELARHLAIEPSRALRVGLGAALEAAAWSVDAPTLYAARGHERLVGVGVRAASRLLGAEVEAAARELRPAFRAGRLEALEQVLSESLVGGSSVARAS